MSCSVSRLLTKLLLIPFILFCGWALADQPVIAPLQSAKTQSMALPKAAADTFRGNGWWWPGASQTGTGIFFEVQCDKAFLAYFLYDDAGKAIWYTATGDLIANANGTFNFSGDLLVARGGQPASSNTPVKPTNTPVGRINITFTSPTSAAIQLPQRSFTAERFNFNGLGSTPSGNQPQLGWFWNESQSGRGYAIEVQNNTVFFAMFHYNSDGSPTWNLFSGPVSASGQFNGDFLAINGGQSLNSSYRAPNPASPIPGFGANFSSAQTGTLTFPNNPVSSPITRFAYGSNADGSACRLGGGPGDAAGINYRALSAPADSAANLQQLNQQGAAGYAYVVPKADLLNPGTTETPIFDYYNIFLKAVAGATYDYVADGVQGSAAGALAAWNQRGADGYVLKLIDSQYLYVKSNKRNTTYSYRLVGLPSPATTNLSSLNQLGRDGYALRSTEKFGEAFYSVHVKDNSSNATYAYELTAVPSSAAGFVNIANSQGARFFMYKAGVALSVDPVTGVGDTRLLFERVSTNQTPIEFTTLGASENVNTATVIANANALAARGYLFWSSETFVSGETFSFNLAFYKGPFSANPLYGPVVP